MGDVASKLHQQIISLEKQMACVGEFEKRRIRSMIAFRKSPAAINGYNDLVSCHPTDFIERACAPSKQVNLPCEAIPLGKLKGNLLEKIAAKVKPVALLYRFFNTAAKAAKISMTKEGTKGVLAGYITDEFYQSPKLFPEFTDTQKELPFFEKIKRSSAGTIEMRNRYRRVLNLSLGHGRVEYFKFLHDRGIGTPKNPIFIGSIGGGTGSVEMDIQQKLRERHGIYSRIVVFDVVHRNRINGSFFANMRGADISWVIHTPGESDLLTLLKSGRLGTFLSSPLRGVDACGNDVIIAQGAGGVFHHLVMSGLWAKFSDESILDFLTVSRKLMYPGAHAVVTLSWNKYRDQRMHEKEIPSMRIIDHLGHDHDGVWYRSIQSLTSSRLLERGGFTLTDELDGPILPAIAIAPINFETMCPAFESATSSERRGD